MSKYDLSILIPARNEMFIKNTVEDILKNKRGKTEVIVGLDGVWADPSIDDHPDVRIVYIGESRGQRGMTNILARLSKAKYVAKCDAHTCYDEGFDVKLMEAMKGHDNWTVVPTMLNLHGFDWVCPDGHRRYQSPSGPCKDCGKPTTRDILFRPRKDTPHSTSFRFDRTLHFQYFGEFKKRPEGQGDITPTMSLQGSFFMLTRERYWALNICDEEHGSWGQQGTEVACKTWLSGGEVMCVQTTWYAHLFRTQGGDFSFPYRQDDAQVKHARKYSKQLFLEGKWPLAIHDLQWLIDKFAPMPDWENVKAIEIKEAVPSKGIIYYTDNTLPTKLAHRVQDFIKAAGLLIVSASLKPMDKMGTNLYFPVSRGKLTMFLQILAALEASTTEIVFFCEHDVLYHSSHFDFTPSEKDKFYYNTNVWRVQLDDGKAVTWEANQVAELCGYREHLLEHYRSKVREIEESGFNRSYEPGGRDTTTYEQWRSEFPNIDIRHGKNLTKSKWSLADFRDKSSCVNWQETTIDKIVGWDNLESIIKV